MTRGFFRGTALAITAAAGMTALAQNANDSGTNKPAQPTLIDAAARDYGMRPVAYIYNDVPVTRAELAEYLIARGGYEKVELLVNKKIIEKEAADRGIVVTPQEMEAAVAKDIGDLGIRKQEFIEVVLAKYGKTYYEWMEDVVRPRLLLTAMCRQDVAITEEDLKWEFERQYGEKRQVQLIMFPKGDSLKEVTRIWERVRNNADEFDRAARQQANPGLASTAGHVSPIGRHLPVEDKIIEEKAFKLQSGEVSEILEASQGYIIIKCIGVIKANDTVEFEKVRNDLHNSVFEIKLAKELPKCFEKLKAKAKPLILMSGPPSQWRFDKQNREKAEDVLKEASATSPPKP